ncbi:hypothetical protein R1flu_029181 [Riccia fluitans]|uniref:Uncharacterized protein n=1 Tax=Riccia fluitans TaxID=41844 RepID=A0ABD1XPG1_9MARC
MGSSSKDTLKRFAEHLQTRFSAGIIKLSYGVREYNRFFEIPGELSDLSGQQKRVLLEVLQAIGKCKLDQLTFDDVPGAELLSSEEWDSSFSSLLSGQSSLENILIHCTGAMYSTVCAHVGAFLARSSTLESLWFGLPGDRDIFTMIPLSNAAVRALSEGLVQTKCLRELRVFSKVVEMAYVLTSAFTGDVRNTSVECLHLPGNLERLGIAMPVLLSSNNQNLKVIRLFLERENVTPDVVDDFRKVAESCRTRESSVVDASRKVFLEFICDTTAKLSEDDGGRAFSCLDSWADASKLVPMLKTNLQLNFTGSGRGEHGNVERGDVKGWFSDAVHRCIHFNGLQVTLWWNGPVIDMDNFHLLCESIQSNEYVESLFIYYDGSRANVDRKCWTHLFHCLRHKRRLKKLTFYDEHAGDETFRSLMDLLQVNIYLEDVDLFQESEGKSAMVKEALRRNRAQASYFYTLRDARLPFENARAGRIFLCGNPHAGKQANHIKLSRNERSFHHMY